MISTTLKNLASQYRLAINKSMVYGYLQGSFVTLTEGPFYRRMSIYVGCVNVTLPEGEELSPAAQCSAMIVDMVTKASGEQNLYGLMRNRFMPAVVVNHSGSVVTLNFARNEAGQNGFQRFIAEMLPRITPLTAPLQCCHCGEHTHAQGYPVEYAADTAVPMHAECLQEAARASKASIWPGAIGATVGALIGTIIWTLIFHAGLPGALGTLAILLLTLGGYKLLHGLPGKTQAITVVFAIMTALLLSMIFGYVWLLRDQYAAYGSVVSGMMQESTYLRVAAQRLFTSNTTLTQIILNLVTGLVFAAIGAASGYLHYAGCAPATKPKAMPGQA